MESCIPLKHRVSNYWNWMYFLSTRRSCTTPWVIFQALQTNLPVMKFFIAAPGDVSRDKNNTEKATALCDFLVQTCLTGMKILRKTSLIIPLVCWLFFKEMSKSHSGIYNFCHLDLYGYLVQIFYHYHFLSLSRKHIA